MKKKCLILIISSLGIGCATRFLKFEDQERLETDKEFTQAFKVVELEASQPDSGRPDAGKPAPGKPDPGKPTASQAGEAGLGLPKAPEQVKGAAASAKKKKGASSLAKTPAVRRHPMDYFAVAPGQKRQPEWEDTEGFAGRRAMVDPYREGEKITFDLTWFNISAGYFTLELKPLKVVNQRKAYHMYLTAKSSSLFSRIYQVDDWAETFIDYDTLLPFSYSINARESGQLRNLSVYFDWISRRAKLWDKKYTKKAGATEKKLDWEIKGFSQNVLSAAFYLRSFKLTPGKKLAFFVADEGRNILFKGDVLRREKIKTDIGEFDTVVVKPEFTVDGVFKPIGENYLWLTDDDYKHIVRFESKIKIGAIVGKLRSLERGIAK